MPPHPTRIGLSLFGNRTVGKHVFRMVSACGATHQTFAAYSKVEGFEPYIRSSPTLILLGSSEGPHIAAR